jgi:hypothetical protein
VTFKDDVSIEGDLYTSGNVEFSTDDHETITFKGHGEVYFNDGLDVYSEDSVNWKFSGDGDVTVRSCDCTYFLLSHSFYLFVVLTCCSFPFFRLQFENNKVTVDTDEG